MEISSFLGPLFIGYFIGSISFTRLFARLFNIEKEIEKTEMDIRGTDEKFSFHSVSATTMAVKKGPLFGMTVSLLDMLKAYIPVTYYLNTYPTEYHYLVVSLASLLGHNFPIYYNFKGGRGMSPLFGSLFAFDWKSVFVSSIGGLVFGLIIMRDMFFAFTSGPLFLIPYFWFTKKSIYFVLYSILLNLIFWVAVIPELQTYLKLRKTGVLQEAERLERMNPSEGGTLGRFTRIFRKQNEDDN
jgi:glycerol-3-phosphate acyltransferase PlsY